MLAAPAGALRVARPQGLSCAPLAGALRSAERRQRPTERDGLGETAAVLAVAPLGPLPALTLATFGSGPLPTLQNSRGALGRALGGACAPL